MFFCLPDLPVIVCNTAELECKNGRCVPESWVCDGEDDCGDRTDENNCDPGQFHNHFIYPILMNKFYLKITIQSLGTGILTCS